jgi:hypothetical protein
MIEVYYWEDDPDAELLLDLLKERNLEHNAISLDAEEPNARPSATYKGKTYWELDELTKVLESE